MTEQKERDNAPPIPYKTKELNEAAFLWCQEGVRLVSVEPHLPEGARNRTETFFFEFEVRMTDKELRKLLFDYSNEECLVEPQMFVRKQSNLRDRLYTVKKKYQSTRQRK